jgi:hypothetical protein
MSLKIVPVKFRWLGGVVARIYSYLEDELGAGYDGIDGIWGVPVMIFESENVSPLLQTRENRHLMEWVVGGVVGCGLAVIVGGRGCDVRAARFLHSCWDLGVLTH